MISCSSNCFSFVYVTVQFALKCFKIFLTEIRSVQYSCTYVHSVSKVDMEKCVPAIIPDIDR